MRTLKCETFSVRQKCENIQMSLHLIIIVDENKDLIKFYKMD